MNINLPKNHSFLKTISLPLAVVAINLLIILFPRESIAAAKEGLSLWFKNVLPSLLPFLIGTNLLTATGFVNFLGVLLEPIMYPLFGVPGCGGFALAVGLLSGYPMGAKVTAFLNEKGDLTKHESERLLAFVNNSGPLFIIGSVGAGMFANIYAGYFILAVHYISAFSTGILFRFYKAKRTIRPRNEKRLLQKAYRSLQDAKAHDPRPFGAKLGDSVTNSMETILQIGGFIMLFCVLVKILEITNIFYLLETAMTPIGKTFNIPPKIYKGILTGIIEITNGVKILSDSGLTRSALISSVAVISWGGFSIHAQSISFLGKTQINSLLYLFAKLINVCFAVLYGILLYPLFEKKILSVEISAVSKVYDTSMIDKFFHSTTYFGLTLLAVFIIGIAAMLLRKITYSLKRYNRL